jgi:hypothetical protein
MLKHRVPHPQMRCNTHIELKYLAGEPTHPWAGLRYVGNGRGGEIVTDLYAEPMDAANEMLAVRLPGETVSFPDWLKDQLTTAWYIEGVEVYRAGLDRTMCRNAYAAQGYDAAWKDDVQPVVFRRNPELVGVRA